MRTKPYSSYLNSIAGLIGVQVADLSTSDLTIINTFFNKSMKYIWQQTNWVDVCPYGEYRVPNNALVYSRDFENAAWTSTALTVTPNAVPNPVDTQSNADLLLETAATSAHKIAQSVTFNAAQTSTSIFAQPVNGRNWLQITANDGSNTFSAFFNLTGTSGVVGTLGANTTATVQLISGLFYQATITYTPAATAINGGTVSFLFSTDGSTTSYAGTVSKGMYLWGASTLPTALSGASMQLIPWEQTGEEAIDLVFNAWNSSPITANAPARIGYRQTNNGLQIINSSYGWNAQYYVQSPSAASTAVSTPLSPVYLYYRKRVPDYTGAAYSAATTYAVGNQMYFTNSAGDADYYKCLVATTSGQSPDTTPYSWKLLSIPFVFFDYAVYDSFASWLLTEGQAGKAAGMSQAAQDLMDREADRQERSMGIKEPMKVRTHLTSRPMPTR